jgi:hypothetical protein
VSTAASSIPPDEELEEPLDEASGRLPPELLELDELLDAPELLLLLLPLLLLEDELAELPDDEPDEDVVASSAPLLEPSSLGVPASPPTCASTQLSTHAIVAGSSGALPKGMRDPNGGGERSLV